MIYVITYIIALLAEFGSGRGRNRSVTLAGRRRLKLIVAYDGGDFAGWQSQRHGNTIQDQLERSLTKICGEEVSVTGAGRTDAGVHALGQCTHADVPVKKLSPADWINALNGTLSPTIRIQRARFVAGSFHARFSARAKLYRYRIANSAILSPFELGRAWHVARPLNLPVLKEAAALFVGRHDFAGFAASRGKVETDTVRTIESVRITGGGNAVAIEFWGEGFLYKMVRMMTGALVRCASGKESLDAIAARLEAPAHVNSLPKLRGGKSGVVNSGLLNSGSGIFLSGASENEPVIKPVVAPAEGLYLVRVRY
jgi:tRNA pseudouridine38-40 synthase